MLPRTSQKTPIIAVCVIALGWASSANAALFNIVYDDFGDNSIGNIVGTGTFGYDGVAAVGIFALSTLTNISFSASFSSGPLSGNSFSTSDILTDPNLTGISVFDLGGSQLGLVFTGFGGQTSGGSLDLLNPAGAFLTHEPTSAIGDRIGCCGGNGTINLYAPAAGIIGDYRATTALAEPGTFALMIVGLAGIGLSRRRR